MSRGYDNALLLVTKTIDKVMTGELELKDFKCHTGAARSNPLRRVTPVKFIEEGREQVYDKEKYRDMLLEAAETVLGYFGFDRTLFGDTSRSKNRKWFDLFKEDIFDFLAGMHKYYMTYLCHGVLRCPTFIVFYTMNSIQPLWD